MKTETLADVGRREVKRIDDLIEQAKEDLQRDAQSHSVRLTSLHKQRQEMIAGINVLTHEEALQRGAGRLMGEKDATAGAGQQRPYYGEVTNIDQVGFNAGNGEKAEFLEVQTTGEAVKYNARADLPPTGGDREKDIGNRLEIVLALIKSPGMFSPSGLISTAKTLERYVLTGETAEGKSNGTD